MDNLRRMAGALRSVALQSVVAAIACWTLTLAYAAPSQTRTAREPLGVYAHVDIESAIKDYVDRSNQTKPGACSALSHTATGSEPSEYTNAHTYLKDLYTALLNNPAVAGIVLGIHWCLIQPQSADEASNDWSYLDDVFKAATVAKKNVQLHVVPGNDSPLWLFDMSPSCDPVIEAQAPNSAYQDCGWVTFEVLPEALQNADSMKLPLPWSSRSNSAYASQWTKLLAELSGRYGTNPAFVSIAVDGPVSQSTEMILPTSANGSKFPNYNGISLKVDLGWEDLIANSFPAILPATTSRYSSAWDQAFIDAWSQTILAYENIFSGVTLTLTPDDGKNMPELGDLPPSDQTPLWNTNCATSDNRDPMKYLWSCEAKAAVVSAFVAARGPTEKSTTVGGFTASDTQMTGDLGLPGGKALTLPPQFPPLLAGAQFDHAVTSKGSDSSGKPLIDVEGCLPPPPEGPGCSAGGLTPEGAAYNVIANFFSGTVAASIYNEPTPAPQFTHSLNFLIMEYADICYAATNTCAPLNCGAAVCASMQNLIATASRDLSATAGKSPLLGSPLSIGSACLVNELPPPACPCTGSGSSCP